MAEKDKITLTEDQIKSIISENESLRKTNEELVKQISELSQTIANLNETLEYMKRKMFGKSREKASSELEGQLDFFNEIEASMDPSVKEPDATEFVQGYTKTSSRKPKATREEILADLPVQEIICNLPDSEKICPLCQSELKCIGKKFVREELLLIPARVKRIKYYQEVYACPKCKDPDGDDEFVTVGAETPSPLLKHSLASPSTVAYIMYEKFFMDAPLYRQEANWLEQGVKLSRATMANWCNKCALEYMKPIYNRLHEELIRRDIVHADEVPCQVLKEPGRKATAKSYMWVYVTGNDGRPTIALFDYNPGRKGDYAKEFLKGYKGFLQCDGYQGYNSLKDVQRIGCIAHLRRKFYDAIPVNLPADGKKLPAEIGVAYCDKLFALEREFKGLDDVSRKAKRLSEELPVIQSFWKWIDGLNPASGSKLATAVTYAKNQRQNLEGYLQDGRLECSNNKAERVVKTYVMGRKNFLFHDTVKGAEASAIILSLVDTAKANGLNVYKYLYTVLLYMPDYINEPEGIEELMPWSEFIQSTCAGPQNKES